MFVKKVKEKTTFFKTNLFHLYFLCDEHFGSSFTSVCSVFHIHRHAFYVMLHFLVLSVTPTALA